MLDSPSGVHLRPQLTVFFATFSVAREATALTWMNRVVAGPGPAAELVPTVVGVRLADFLLSVHDEGTILDHALGNRAALEEE